MNIGIHHYIYKYKSLEVESLINNKRFKRFIDHSIYFAGIFGVLVIIPQIYKIWIEKDLGVSLVTWVGFLFAALFWLFYGLIHKEKPIIFTNLAVISTDLMVVIGVLIFK